MPTTDWSAAAERILAKCQRDANGCLNWTRSAGANGYGRVRVGGRLYLPYRVVAFSAGIVREIDRCKPDDNVLHQCDNPKCCNPNHLRRGTRAQNMRECVARGRHASSRNVGQFVGRPTSGQIIKSTSI